MLNVADGGVGSAQCEEADGGIEECQCDEFTAEDVGCASNSEGAVTSAEVKRNNDVQRRILC